MSTNPKPSKALGWQTQMWKSRVKRYLAEHGGKRIEGIQETTRERVVKVLRSAVQQGQNPRQAALAVRDAMQGISRARAERIARTEVVGASNAGRDLMAAMAGVPLKKTWIATHDDRTRFHHLEADGQTVPRHGYFVVNGERLRWPGDTSLGATPANIVNCRCTVAYNLDETGDDLRAQAVEYIMSQLRSDGFSIRPGQFMTLRNPKKGYMVASKVQGLIIPLDVFEIEDVEYLVRDWVNATWKHIRGRPNYYYGGWLEIIEHRGRKRPCFFVDVSVNVMDRDLAIRWGKERDQRGIWDVVNMVTIDTGGTGGIDKIFALLDRLEGRFIRASSKPDAPPAPRGVLESLGIDFGPLKNEPFDTIRVSARILGAEWDDEVWRAMTSSDVTKRAFYNLTRSDQFYALRKQAWQPSSMKGIAPKDLFDLPQRNHPELPREVLAAMEEVLEAVGNVVLLPYPHNNHRLRLMFYSDKFVEDSLGGRLNNSGFVMPVALYDKLDKKVSLNNYGIALNIEHGADKHSVQWLRGTLVHELGHVFDYMLSPDPGQNIAGDRSLGPKGMTWQEATRLQSPDSQYGYTPQQVQAIHNLRNLLLDMAFNEERKRAILRSNAPGYWASPTEVFARAFMQWVGETLPDDTEAFKRLKKDIQEHIRLDSKHLTPLLYLTPAEAREFDGRMRELLEAFGLQGRVLARKPQPAPDQPRTLDGEFINLGIDWSKLKNEIALSPEAYVLGVGYDREKARIWLGRSGLSHEAEADQRKKHTEEMHRERLAAFVPNRRESVPPKDLVQVYQTRAHDMPQPVVDTVNNALEVVGRLFRLPKVQTGETIPVQFLDSEWLKEKGLPTTHNVATHQIVQPFFNKSYAYRTNAVGIVFDVFSLENYRVLGSADQQRAVGILYMAHELAHVLDAMLSGVPGDTFTEAPGGPENYMYGALFREQARTRYQYTQEQLKMMHMMRLFLANVARNPKRVRDFQLNGLDQRYWNSPKEIFARAVEQWVAKNLTAKAVGKTQHALLKKMFDVRKQEIGTKLAYLTPQEYKEFDYRMRRLLEAFGLRGDLIEAVEPDPAKE